MTNIVDKELPKYILVSDFSSFRLYDLEFNSKIDFPIQKWVDYLDPLGFIAGYDCLLLISIAGCDKSFCNVPNIGIGNKPIDDSNYLFTEEEKKEFPKREPKAKKLFRKWLGSDELLKATTDGFCF